MSGFPAGRAAKQRGTNSRAPWAEHANGNESGDLQLVRERELAGLSRPWHSPGSYYQL